MCHFQNRLMCYKLARGFKSHPQVVTKVHEYPTVTTRSAAPLRCTIKEKTSPPCNHLDIGALRLPTVARNQTGDWLMLR